MKNFYLLILFFFASYSLTAQDWYAEKWREVERLETKSQIEDARKIVDRIVQRATRKDIQVQLIKAFLFRSKFSMINEEDARENILLDLNTAIATAQNPETSIYHSLYAQFLLEYYSANQWRVDQRTKGASKGGFETWDKQHFQDQVLFHINKSLESKKQTGEIPVDQYAVILDNEPMTRRFRPSLYDLLTHRAIDMLRGNSTLFNTLSKSAIPTDHFFELKIDKIDLDIADSSSTDFKVDKLFRELELYATSTDRQEVMFYNRLKRLEHAYVDISSQKVDARYEDTLKQFGDEISEQAFAAIVHHNLAAYYYNLSNLEIGDKKKYRIKAKKLAEETVKKYTNTIGYIRCQNLLDQINEKSLSIVLEDYVIPDKPVHLKVEYRNVKNIQVYVFPYQVDNNYLRADKDSLHETLLARAQKKGSILQLKDITLPESEDTYEHSILTSLRGVPAGSYMVVYKTVEDGKSTVGGVLLNSTRITLLEKEEDNNTVLQVLDREYGNPLIDAVVHVKRKDTSIWKAYNLNKNGILSLDTKDRERLDLMVSHKQDTLETDIYARHYNYGNSYEDDEEEVIVSSEIYLDRAIYRPGQTVYFKAIAAVKSKDKISVIPDEELIIFVENSNGDEIYGTKLKTNEFGSLHGSFTLPQNGPTGEFTITIESDEETEFWDTVDDYENNEKDFRVEEYKRPTFKVDFEEIKETYKPKDSVVVYAFAKALLGQPLTDADVSVTVKRKLGYPRYFDGEYLSSKDEVIASYDTITDARGRIPIKFLASPDQKLFTRNKYPNYQYTIEVEVTDINGETQENNKTLNIGKEFLRLNVITSEMLDEEDNSVNVSLEDLNALPLNGQVKIEVYKQPKRQDKFLHYSMSNAEFIATSANSFKKYDIEDISNWKLVHSDSSKVDGLKNFQLPITQNWINDNYKIIASARIDSLEVSSKTEKQVTIWTDKNLPANAGIIDHRTQIKKDKVYLDLFTMLDSVTVNVVAYDKVKQVDQKYVLINKGKSTISYDVKQFEGRNIRFNLSTFRNNYFIATSDDAVKPITIEKPKYEIITKSFRDRLRPGEEETWSFEIKSEQDSHPELEFLASMYDSSLDQFTTSNWHGIYFYESYHSYTPNRMSHVTPLDVTRGNLSLGRPFYRNLYNYYDDFNLYGLNFGRFDSSYGQYLRRKIQQYQAQTPIQGQVVGQVIDSSGEPIFGATIQIEGSDVFTTTDFDGNYSIPVSAKQKLIFSYTGYDSQSVYSKEGTVVDVSLGASLEEVVVLGYRTSAVKRSNVAASIVSSDSIIDKPNASFIQRLQGQVAGLTVQNASGQPGANSLIQIRGVASINGKTEPLIVVDGVPISASEFRKLDPSTVKETAVLKDAAGTAIYGNRGVNGVIIISTKEGVSIEDLINQEMMASNVQVRRDLDETAFFLPELRTDKEGHLSFNFTSPELLTQWKFRLFGHDKQANTTSLEKTVVTQKELSIVPNAPRFLREGDTLTLSTKIANLTPKKINGFARLELFDATTMQPIDDLLKNNDPRVSFTAAAKGNTAVSWTITVPQDIPAVTYRIIAASDKYSDGEENVLPVLSNRELVTESRRIWVRSGTEKTVVMDNLVNNTSTTLSSKSLQLEYTTNPSWTAIQSLPYLMEYEHECSEQLFSRYFANAVAAQVLNQNPKIKAGFDYLKENEGSVSALKKNEAIKNILLSHTPWVLDAQNQEEEFEKLAQLFDQKQTQQEQKEAIEKLGLRQASDGGFPWFNGGRTSPYITRHILAGIGRIHKMGIGQNDPYLEYIAENALDYLDNEWKKSLTEYLDKKNKLEDYNFGFSYWHYQYARSFFTDENEHQVLKDAYDVAFAKAKNERASLPLYQQILMSLAIHRNGDSKTAKAILDGLSQSAVKDHEKGAFWKKNQNGYYWYASTIETHATAIEAYSEIDPKNKLITELKVWLLHNKKAKSWKSTKATSLAVYALLYQGDNWATAQANSEITWANEKVEFSKEDELAELTGQHSLQLKPEEITKEHGKLTIENKGDVPGFGAMYWQYLEQLDKIKSDSEGDLSITKKLYLLESSMDGDELKPITRNNPIKIGDRVVVRLEITANQDMDFVHLKDLRASGLEPVDVISEYNYQDGLGYYQSTRDAATHFFFDHIKKGTYVFEYELKANNAGNFSSGIAHLENMYAPEFSSHSNGFRLTITE